MLAFETEDGGGAGALQLPGLVARPQPVVTQAAKFDLSVALIERRGAEGEPGGIAGVLEYAADLFDRASIETLGRRLVRLLEAAVADASRPIGSLAILEPDERATILQGWNDTAQSFRDMSSGADTPATARATTLPSLFAAQAQRTPDAVAVVFEDRELSYAALDAHANRLAQHLQGLGVGPETVVGLCVERSPEMVVGLLGILKAGGAYLPLDPNYPRERLAFMLADAGAPVLITQQALLDRLPEMAASDRHVVRLDADWPVIARQPATAPAIALDPRHPAYVIYTSGSTGAPKGVVVEHRGIPNLAAAQLERFTRSCRRPRFQFASSMHSTPRSQNIATTLIDRWRRSILPPEELSAEMSCDLIMRSRRHTGAIVTSGRRCTGFDRSDAICRASCRLWSSPAKHAPTELVARHRSIGRRI